MDKFQLFIILISIEILYTTEYKLVKHNNNMYMTLGTSRGIFVEFFLGASSRQHSKKRARAQLILYEDLVTDTFSTMTL